MSKPLPAPPPVVRLVPDLVEHASERFGERPFLLRHVAGAWTGYSFMAAARAVRAFATLLEREGVRPGARAARRSMLKLLSLDAEGGSSHWDVAQREHAAAPPRVPPVQPNDLAVLLF